MHVNQETAPRRGGEGADDGGGPRGIAQSSTGWRKRARSRPAAVVIPLATVACAASVGLLLLAPREETTAPRSRSVETTPRPSRSVHLLPPVLENNLAPVYDPVDRSTETAIFWHVPKAGGTTIEKFVSCLGLVQANQNGAKPQFGHAGDTELTVFEPWPGYKVVNVDTTERSGLQHAQSLGLARSGLADVIFTSYPHEAAQIFDTDRRGRMITLLRHPVEREVSKFYYLQHATWERLYRPETRGWTISQYVDSGIPQGNWMVSTLANKHRSRLGVNDLEFAKQFLKEKFLVGLMEETEGSLAESLGRFGQYLGWGNTQECADQILTPGGGSNRHPHPKVAPGSDDWNAIAAINPWDIMLYNYAVELFEEQAGLVKLSSPISRR